MKWLKENFPLILSIILSIAVFSFNIYLWWIGEITENILTGFAAEFLAVVLGLHLGLNIDRFIRGRRGKETKSSVLGAIKDEIKHNIELLVQIRKELESQLCAYC